MTDITLEQRAALVADLRAAVTLGRPLTRAEVDEIEAALRLSAGADWVLVPARMSGPMRDAFYANRVGDSAWYGDPEPEDLDRWADDAWTDLLAAAPRHEPGEG